MTTILDALASLGPLSLILLTSACVLGPHPVCEVCGDEYDEAAGCQHDGHNRCPACLHTCSECRDAINDYIRD